MTEYGIDACSARDSVFVVVNALSSERNGFDQRYDDSHDLTPNSPTLAENHSYRMWAADYAHAAIAQGSRTQDPDGERVTTGPEMSTKFNRLVLGSVRLNRDELIGERLVSGSEAARYDDHAGCTKGEELDYVAV